MVVPFFIVQQRQSNLPGRLHFSVSRLQRPAPRVASVLSIMAKGAMTAKPASSLSGLNRRLRFSSLFAISGKGSV